MDYKRVKSGREKGLVWLALILTAVILVQCVMNIVLIISNRQTKAMFDEALQGQLTMQEEINSLKGIDNGNTEIRISCGALSCATDWADRASARLHRRLCVKRFVNRLKKHLNFRVRRYTDISKRRRLFWVRNERVQNRICRVRLLHW